MVRSIWIGPPVIALALTAAWGQPPASPAPARPGERVITVQEMDKPGRPCRIVRSWQLANGAKAYDVQAVQSGEMLTIVESGPLAMPSAPGRPPVRSVATTIHHWTRDGKRPKNCPAPPEGSGVVQVSLPPAAVARPMPSAPAAAPPPATPYGAASHGAAAPHQAVPHHAAPHAAHAPHGHKSACGPECHDHHHVHCEKLPPADFRVKQPEGPAPSHTTDIRYKHPGWKRRAETKKHGPAHTVECPEECPSACPPAPHAAPEAPKMTPSQTRAPSKRKNGSAGTFAAEKGWPPPAPGAVTISPPGSVSVGAIGEVHKPTLKERLFNKDWQKSPFRRDKAAAAAVAATPPVPAAPRKIPEAKPMVTAAVEQPKPGDWRQSWGKESERPSEPTPPERTASRPKPTKSPEGDDLPYARRTKGSDPLTNPGAYSKGAPEVESPKETVTRTGGKPLDLPPPPPVVPELVAPPPPPPAPVAAKPPMQVPTTPPGVGSVMAAGNPPYIPVPIVTVPQSPPPVPPSPTVPRAPVPNRTVAGPSVAGMPPPGAANAFTTPGPTRPIPSETIPGELTVNAFGGPPPAGVVVPQPPMAAGYGRPPQGYGPMPAMPMQPSAGMPGVARIPVMPAGYSPAAYYNYGVAMGGMGMMPMPAAGLPNPMMMAPPAAGHPHDPAAAMMPSIVQMMQMLSDSDYPSQREWAADQLAGLNWRTHPHAVQALVGAAKSDPAPMVRVSCVRSLMRMQANTMPVVSVVQGLKDDPDPRVRDAVSEALVAFGVAPSGGAGSPIQPAGGPGR